MALDRRLDLSRAVLAGISLGGFSVLRPSGSRSVSGSSYQIYWPFVSVALRSAEAFTLPRFVGLEFSLDDSFNSIVRKLIPTEQQMVLGIINIVPYGII